MRGGRVPSDWGLPLKEGPCEKGNRYSTLTGETRRHKMSTGELTMGYLMSKKDCRTTEEFLTLVLGKRSKLLRLGER